VLDMSVKKNLLKAFYAESLGKALAIIVQIFNVPILLKFWGVELYGEWLIVSTIPQYLAISDIGFANVAANEMTMLRAKNKKKQINNIFNSALVFTSIVAIIVFTLLLIVLLLVDLKRVFRLQELSAYTINITTILLAVSVLLGLQIQVFQAGLRCDGNYAEGVFIGHILNFVMFFLSIACVYLGGDVVNVATINMMVKIIGLLIVSQYLQLKSPWIQIDLSKASFTTVKYLATPAFTFMLIPLTNALSNQGIISVIAITLTPQSVALFATTRTICNLSFQFLSMIQYTIWAEISTAFGSKNLDLVRKLFRYSSGISFWLAFLSILGLLFSGKFIYELWLDGKILLNNKFFLIMLLGMLAQCFWYTCSVILTATNKHNEMSIFYLVTVSSSLALSYFLSVRIGLIGFAIALLISHIFMSIYVTRKSLFVIEYNWVEYFSYVLNPLNNLIVITKRKKYFEDKC
jgi:O-antigen/teichoic acid export membrane protein